MELKITQAQEALNRSMSSPASRRKLFRHVNSRIKAAADKGVFEIAISFLSVSTEDKVALMSELTSSGYVIRIINQQGDKWDSLLINWEKPADRKIK